MKFSKKIKGIFRVSATNLISLGLSLLTSFILPLFISVEEYGYWQLFVMYCGYVGLFAFGFNDGIHLNYANCDYTSELWGKFRSFKKLLTFLTIVETVVLICLLPFLVRERDHNFYVWLLVVLNIIPTIIPGMFHYMNQSTLRFKQYATGNIVDKIVFAGLLVLLIVLNEKNSIIYIAAYTVSKYLIILYHFFTSKEIFFEKGIPLKELRGEIIAVFKGGMPLMLASLFGGGSIIIGSRLLVQNKFGIEAFSAYSFSLHTIVVAAQFIGAIAAVFYPLLKRSQESEMKAMYLSFDKVSSLLAALLLLTYYPAAFLVQVLYTKYSAVLAYLYIIYPLFIFQCKSNVLVINMYKVRNEPVKLIFVNMLGVVIHLLFVLPAYYLFGSIYSIASAALLAYMVWYYVFQVILYKKSGWNVPIIVFSDVLIVIVFISINIVVSKFFTNTYTNLLVSCLAYLLAIVSAYLVLKKSIKSSLREFNYLMRD